MYGAIKERICLDVCPVIQLLRVMKWGMVCACKLTEAFPLGLVGDSQTDMKRCSVRVLHKLLQNRSLSPALRFRQEELVSARLWRSTLNINCSELTWWKAICRHMAGQTWGLWYRPCEQNVMLSLLWAWTETSGWLCMASAWIQQD